jgi:CxxC motif-containing protein
MAQEKRELICINCPLGCPLVVTLEDGEVTSVEGNTCKRGDVYGRKEVTNPTRIVTTSVPVDGSASERMVSVKTASDVPKAKIFDVMEALKDVRATAPVHIGDVILDDVCGTGVSIVATREA